MVYQIIKSRYGIFIESLIWTLLILLIGFFIGFYLESYRLNKIIDNYKDFEVGALDLKLQNYYYQIMDQSSCDIAIEQNLDFADRIYSQGLIIEKYEKAGELLENSLLNEKKKYVLLQTELWLNSILLKNKCNGAFHTVVYIYSQGTDSAKESEQNAVSEVLMSLKEKYDNNIILIPIAGDLGMDSVNMQLKIYNITYLPTILIDEKIKLESFQSQTSLEKYIV